MRSYYCDFCGSRCRDDNFAGFWWVCDDCWDELPSDVQAGILANSDDAIEAAREILPTRRSPKKQQEKSNDRNVRS